METKFLPFWKWKKLKMTFVEKLLLVFTFIFHAMMIPSLVWLVLMAEKVDDDQRLLLANVRIFNWTLKIIIGIGWFIEIVFMVCQCKLFVKLFHKWRNCNRIIYILNAPKIGGTVQQQKQHADEFSAISQLPKNELTSEDTNFLPPEERKFYCFQSDSNGNIHSSNRYCVQFCDERNTSVEKTKSKTSSSEISLITDYDLPLSEVVVISTAADDNPKTIADKIQTTENDYRKNSFIAATDNALVPVENHKCRMNECVATSTVRVPVKGKLMKNICHFFSGHNKIHAEDKDFLLAQEGINNET